MDSQDFRDVGTSNGAAIAGLTCAIAAILLSWVPPVGFVCWVGGLVFSIVGLKAANRGASHRGVAIAGIVISLLGTVIVLLIIGLGVFLAVSDGLQP